MKVYETFDVRYSTGTWETYLNTIYQQYLSVDAFESDREKGSINGKNRHELFLNQQQQRQVFGKQIAVGCVQTNLLDRWILPDTMAGEHAHPDFESKDDQVNWCVANQPINL